MKQEIINVLTYIANRASETVVYGKYWGTEFCYTEICEGIDKAMESIKDNIDWNTLTDKDCKELGFKKWEEDNPLRLIPIWLYKAIPVGLKLTSINEDEIIFNGSNIDTDTRFGCLAYGIIPVDKR